MRALARKLLVLVCERAVYLTSNIILAQTGEAPNAALRDSFQSAPRKGEPQMAEIFYEEKLVEQHVSSTSHEGGGGAERRLRLELDNFKLLHRTAIKKLHALEADLSSAQREQRTTDEKLRKATKEERKATRLASAVMSPLEQMHVELEARVQSAPAEKQRLGRLLNHTRELLAKHKYAFDWKAEVQRAQEAASDGDKSNIDAFDGVHQPTPLSAVCATAVALGVLAYAEWLLSAVGLQWAMPFLGLEQHDVLLFLGAFGALSALLYGAPAAPLGRARVTAAGFALVGALTMGLRYANVLAGTTLGVSVPVEAEQVLAPALGIGAMLYFKTAIHPPAAAMAIQFMQLRRDDPTQQDPLFLLAPLAVGVAWMLLVQVATAHAVRYATTIRVAAPSTAAPDAPPAAPTAALEKHAAPDAEASAKDAANGDGDGAVGGRKKTLKFSNTWRNTSVSAVATSRMGREGDDAHESGSDESGTPSRCASRRESYEPASRGASRRESYERSTPSSKSPTLAQQQQAAERKRLWGALGPLLQKAKEQDGHNDKEMV